MKNEVITKRISGKGFGLEADPAGRRSFVQFLRGTGFFVLSFLLVLQLQAQHGDKTRINDKGPEHALRFVADEIEWKKGPASFEEGAEFAILEGDPSQPGVFTMRLKLPDGFRISPHWHPNVERVTVLSGNFRLGHGDEFDEAAAEDHRPGSYISLPPEMTHFAEADGETVVQLTSVGPWEINYVKDSDDPRKRTKMTARNQE